jgi:pre-mRNA-processing factor 6
MHHGAVAAARAVYKHTLLHFPKKKSIWLKAAHLEKQSGTPEALDATLQEAVSNCPEVPWYPVTTCPL